MFEEYKDADLYHKLCAIVYYYERMLIDRKTGEPFPGVEDKKEYFIFSTCREALICLARDLIPLDDIMAVFDDFMRGDICGEEKEAFYNMLLEKVIGGDTHE